MQKDVNLIGYNIDLERIRETFFSPSKKRTQKKKKNFFRKRLTFSLLLTFIIILIFFLLNYDFIIIPNKISKKTTTIIKNPYKAYIVDETRNIKFKRTRLPILLISPLNRKTTLYFEFENPINLKDKNLLIHLKKQTYPLKIYVIIRDDNFISNAFSPILIELDSKKDYIVPINFKNLQDIELSKINQIRFIFYTLELQNPIIGKKIEKNYIILKDIFLD